MIMPQDKERHTQTISQTGKCPVCKGTGWMTYKKKPDDCDAELDYATECPECNGGSMQTSAAVKEGSGIPHNFRDYDFTMVNWGLYRDSDGKQYDMEKVRNIIKSFYVSFDQWEKEGLGLYIHSRSRGTGKTMIASCICNELNRKYPWKIKFVSESELVQMDKSANDKALSRAEQDPIGELCNCHLLVIDDLGATQGGAWLENIMFRIMDERLRNNLVTIITSNVPISEIDMNDRTVDRINKMCIPLKLPDVMIRANESMKNKRDFLLKMGVIGN